MSDLAYQEALASVMGRPVRTCSDYLDLCDALEGIGMTFDAQGLRGARLPASRIALLEMARTRVLASYHYAAATGGSVEPARRVGAMLKRMLENERGQWRAA